MRLAKPARARKSNQHQGRDMAKSTRSRDGLDASEQLQNILKQGPDNASVLRGFIGQSDREGYIRLFAELSDTSVSAEIATDDIVGTADVLNNTLGKRVIWIKKGARITVIKTRTTEFGNGPTLNGDELVPVRAGRLNMKLRKAQRDTCVSICTCSTCMSHCTNWCGICVCVEQVKAE